MHAGGLPDLSRMPPGSTAGLPVPFTGCVRRLSVDYETIPLNYSSIVSARNIADCDGTPCGGDLCHHGGSCWLDMDMTPHCHCLQVRRRAKYVHFYFLCIIDAFTRLSLPSPSVFHDLLILRKYFLNIFFSTIN